VRRGEGVRISGGLAQAYYVGVARREATAAEAVCLLPAGTEEGKGTELPQTFELLIRQPAEFPLFRSTTRTGDRAGALVVVDPRELAPLPPIRTVLQSGKRSAAAAVPVRLHARRTEIGTLDLWCAELSGDRRWRLQFDARGGPRGGRDADAAGEAGGILDEAVRMRAADLVRQAFEPRRGARRRTPAASSSGSRRPPSSAAPSGPRRSCAACGTRSARPATAAAGHRGTRRAGST
jgi:hypothetical protein